MMLRFQVTDAEIAGLFDDISKLSSILYETLEGHELSDLEGKLSESKIDANLSTIDHDAAVAMRDSQLFFS